MVRLASGVDRDLSAGDRADLLAARARADRGEEAAADQRQDSALDRVQSEADRVQARHDRDSARDDRGLASS